MRITAKAIKRAKKSISLECGKLADKDQSVCEKAAIRVGRALARELTKCNRLKGRKAMACHKGRIASTKAIAQAKS